MRVEHVQRGQPRCQLRPLRRWQVWFGVGTAGHGLETIPGAFSMPCSAGDLAAGPSTCRCERRGGPTVRCRGIAAEEQATPHCAHPSLHLRRRVHLSPLKSSSQMRAEPAVSAPSSATSVVGTTFWPARQGGGVLVAGLAWGSAPVQREQPLRRAGKAGAGAGSMRTNLHLVLLHLFRSRRCIACPELLGGLRARCMTE